MHIVKLGRVPIAWGAVLANAYALAFSVVGGLVVPIWPHHSVGFDICTFYAAFSFVVIVQLNWRRQANLTHNLTWLLSAAAVNVALYALFFEFHLLH